MRLRISRYPKKKPGASSRHLKPRLPLPWFVVNGFNCLLNCKRTNTHADSSCSFVPPRTLAPTTYRDDCIFRLFRNENFGNPQIWWIRRFSEKNPCFFMPTRNIRFGKPSDVAQITRRSPNHSVFRNEYFGIQIQVQCLRHVQRNVALRAPTLLRFAHKLVTFCPQRHDSWKRELAH